MSNRLPRPVLDPERAASILVALFLTFNVVGALVLVRGSGAMRLLAAYGVEVAEWLDPSPLAPRTVSVLSAFANWETRSDLEKCEGERRRLAGVVDHLSNLGAASLPQKRAPATRMTTDQPVPSRLILLKRDPLERCCAARD